MVAPELLYFLEGLIKRFLQLARGLAQFLLIYIPQLVLDRHYVRIPFLLKRSLKWTDHQWTDRLIASPSYRMFLLT